MNIAVYGAGYVGLVSAVCFAKMGHQVICADINKARIAQLLRGECPIYEEHLSELLAEQQLTGRLQFTDNLVAAMRQVQVHVIATGTPSLPDGSADLSQVFAVVTQLVSEVSADGLLVTKSTVPVGTGRAIQAHLHSELVRQGKSYQIDVASNPEFLREGHAVNDFLHADRIIVGGNKSALMRLQRLYEPLVEQGIPLLCMSLESAELCKYAANTMLACRISFINQISRIAEKVGANIDEIREGIGTDRRIGPHFLQAGIGYGGSCFPKDGRALVQTAESLGVDVPLLHAIEAVNDIQKQWVMERLEQHFNHALQDKVVGIWGLAFKPGTDDMREASSLTLIHQLQQAGTVLRLYDPVAMPSAKACLPSKDIIWCHSTEQVLAGGVDALIIATEWSEFQTYSLQALHEALGDAPLIDGRNCFDLEQVIQAKITYYSVGRPTLYDTTRHPNHAN